MKEASEKFQILSYGNNRTAYDVLDGLGIGRSESGSARGIRLRSAAIPYFALAYQRSL
jgi:hypothetical protein